MVNHPFLRCCKSITIVIKAFCLIFVFQNDFLKRTSLKVIKKTYSSNNVFLVYVFVLCVLCF